MSNPTYWVVIPWLVSFGALAVMMWAFGPPESHFGRKEND